MEGRQSGAGAVKLVLAHEDTIFQYTLYSARSAPAPVQPSCNVIGGPGELMPSLPAGACVCEASAAASVGSIRPTGASAPGRVSAEFFLLRCCPHPWIRPGRAAGQHVPFYSHVPNVQEQSVTTPRAVSSTVSHPLAGGIWGNSRREAEGRVGMRSENRWGRDARGATGYAETPGEQGRRAWPGRVRRSRGIVPSVRGGWICRQPERFILLHSCQAAGAVLQLSHPFGLLLVILPAPRLLPVLTRLELGCLVAPQVRLWAAHGFPSATLRPFLRLSLLTSPRLCVSPRAPATAAGPNRWVL